MTKKISKLLGLALILISFTATAQHEYKTDTDNSVINWKGFKPTGEHYGTIKLTNGFFSAGNNTISGGNFTIDMNSIVNLDMDATSEYNSKLVNHLKSEDFFDSKQFPTATFKIIKATPKGEKTLIQGNLTIKDKTNSIEFLATVEFKGDKLTFKSDTFKIDRSKWDVKYKSKSFFDSLGDKFIYDDMEMTINVTAIKE